MLQVIEKELDKEGRVLLPKEWRKTYGNQVLIMQLDSEIRILPKKRIKLTDLPQIKVDIKSSLDDWHAVEKELLSKAYEEKYF